MKCHTLFPLSFLAVALLAGCAKQPEQPATMVSPATNATMALDEARVITIARQAVSTNDTWSKTATFEVRSDGSGWTVTAWREPRVPGGHRLIRIDQNGQMTAYIRGR